MLNKKHSPTLKDRSACSPQTLAQDSDRPASLPADTQPVPIVLVLRPITSIFSVVRGYKATEKQESGKQSWGLSKNKFT